MFNKLHFYLIITVSLFSSAAHAVPVRYEGNLLPGTTVNGSVGGFSWADEIASQTDFWRFNGVAGDTVTISATRGATGLDPAFSLYFGTTTADEGGFLNDADWGGLQFLTFADDEIDHPGPGGDPTLSGYVLPVTGGYTIALGGFQSTTGGAYSYSLSMISQPIPEPAAAWLMLGGLLVVGRLANRRNQAKNSGL